MLEGGLDSPGYSLVGNKHTSNDRRAGKKLLKHCIFNCTYKVSIQKCVYSQVEENLLRFTVRLMQSEEYYLGLGNSVNCACNKIQNICFF